MGVQRDFTIRMTMYYLYTFIIFGREYVFFNFSSTLLRSMKLFFNFELIIIDTRIYCSDNKYFLNLKSFYYFKPNHATRGDHLSDYYYYVVPRVNDTVLLYFSGEDGRFTLR